MNQTREKIEIETEQGGRIIDKKNIHRILFRDREEERKKQEEQRRLEEERKKQSYREASLKKEFFKLGIATGSAY